MLTVPTVLPAEGNARWRRGRRWALLPLSAVIAAAGVGTFVSTRPTHEEKLTEADIVPFEDRFFDLAEDLARLLEPQLGGETTVKGSLLGIESGSLDRNEAVLRCDRWRDVLVEVRDAVSSIAVAPGLRVVRDRFLDATKAYLTMVALLREAAIAPVEARTELVDRAVRFARKGDRHYDDAVSELRSARATAGMPPDPRIPDPEDPLPPGVEVIDP